MELTMKIRANFLFMAGCALMFVILLPGCATKTAAAAKLNLEERQLSEFVHILEENRNGVLANRDGEQLRTQIITFSFAEGNRVYFCTTGDKPMYTQLLEFPNVSFCTFPADYEPVLSLNGKVIFIEDRALMERALETNYYAKRNFKDIDNPLLRVFCIDVEIIETYSSAGTRLYSAK